MSAQPVEPATPVWSPDPVCQRLASCAVEDVLALPDDVSRVERRDGVMIVVPSSTIELVLERPFPIRMSIGDITP